MCEELITRKGEELQGYGIRECKGKGCVCRFITVDKSSPYPPKDFVILVMGGRKSGVR